MADLVNAPDRPKAYLGDGVYVAPWEGGGLVLTTENGIRVTGEIVLEPDVLQALLDYCRTHGMLRLEVRRG